MNKDNKLIAEAYSNEVVSKKPDVDLLKKKKENFDQTVQKLQHLASEVGKVINKEALDVANEIYYQGEEWYNYYSKVEDKQTRQLAKLVFGAENFAGFAQVSESIQESFQDGVMTDDKGVKRSVPAVVKFAEQNKDKYFQKDFPISKIDKEIKWWDEQNKANPEASNARMMKADTSFPLLIIKNQRYGLSVSDGLNRLKKARDVEDKKVIDVYIVPEEDIPESTIIK